IPLRASGLSLAEATAILTGREKPVLTTLAQLDAPPSKLPPAVDGERVLVGDRKGNLQAFDAAGKRLWSCALKGQLDHEPTVAPDGSVYALGGHALHKVGPEGNLEWTLELPGEPLNAPVLTEDGRVYVSSRGCMLYGVTPDGRIQVSKHDPLGSPHSFFVLPGKGSEVLLVGNNGRMVRYDPSALIFKRKPAGSMPGIAQRPPRPGPDGRWYFITMEPGMKHHLVGLNPATARVEVDVRFPGITLPGFPALGIPGSLAVAMAGGDVKLFDLNGQPRGQLTGLIGNLPMDASLDVTSLGSDGALITGEKSPPRLISQGEELEIPGDFVAAATAPDGSVYVTRRSGELCRLELKADVPDSEGSGQIRVDDRSVQVGSVRLKRRKG
ncbi:MAG: PQQ-binding-like beta-propeller repeat protein, partial [Candidatus Eremiobacterota bacterium]